MTSRQRALLRLGPALVAALALTACSGQASKEAAGPVSPGPTATATTPAATAAPTAAVTAEPTGLTPPAVSPSGLCRDVATNLLGDGSWSGPLTMTVRTRSNRATYTSTRGSGTMTLVVHGARVVSGSWRVRWTSTGDATDGRAKAHLSLVGRIAGQVAGNATRPLVSGAWNLTGTATMTSPSPGQAPIDESGGVAGPMTIRSGRCGGVPAPTATGMFVPSFTSKDAEATFTGKARWTASQRG